MSKSVGTEVFQERREAMEGETLRSNRYITSLALRAREAWLVDETYAQNNQTLPGRLNHKPQPERVCEGLRNLPVVLSHFTEETSVF